MSKAKKVLEEAREIKNPELDLADKGISSFEELPGLRKYNAIIQSTRSRNYDQIWYVV